MPEWQKVPLGRTRELRPWTGKLDKTSCLKAGCLPCSLALHGALVDVLNLQLPMHCFGIKIGWSGLGGLSPQHAGQVPQCQHAFRFPSSSHDSANHSLRELCAQVDGAHPHGVRVLALTDRLCCPLRLYVALTRRCVSLQQSSSGQGQRCHESQLLVALSKGSRRPALPLPKHLRAQRGAYPGGCFSSSPSSNSSTGSYDQQDPHRQHRPLRCCLCHAPHSVLTLRCRPSEARVAQQDEVCVRHENTVASLSMFTCAICSAGRMAHVYLYQLLRICLVGCQRGRDGPDESVCQGGRALCPTCKANLPILTGRTTWRSPPVQAQVWPTSLQCVKCMHLARWLYSPPARHHEHSTQLLWRRCCRPIRIRCSAAPLPRSHLSLRGP